MLVGSLLFARTSVFFILPWSPSDVMGKLEVVRGPQEVKQRARQLSKLIRELTA